MRPVDLLKALGLAVLVLAANLALTVAVVFAWSQAFARGHTPEFYTALAMKIAQWSGPVGGLVLMFAVALVFGRRVPARNPFMFAGAVFVFYAMIDAATGLAMAPAAEVFKPLFLMALTLAGLSGQAGAAMARRTS